MASQAEQEKRVKFLKATWANVIGNTLKITVEGGIGLIFGSLALVTDAAHSVADLLSSLVVLIWGRLYYRDPDRNHPHGHERIEPLTALFVGGVLILIGAKFLFDAGTTLYYGTNVRFSYYLIGALIFGSLIMSGVYLYTVKMNRDVGLPSLAALARDCRNDIFTSLAAMVGVVGLGFGYEWLDPASGGLVSIIMIYEGVDIGVENINYLAGAAPPEEKRREIRRAARDHPGVRGLHDVVCYYSGPVIEVELHIEVDGDLTVREAHEIEAEVRNKILEVEEVYDAHLHLDPAGMDEWKEAEEQR